MFADRADAGRRLARRLEAYRDRRALVLAIPKGGVEPALEIARHLRADFSLVVSRKLPFPADPEAGFGAVAEDGSLYVVPGARQWLSHGEIESIQKEQEGEIRRRVEALRGGEPLPEMIGRTAILVDDGLAVGSTMRAALMLCRKRDAGKVVVAVPVCGRDTATIFSEIADEFVVLEVPPLFQAVAQAYRRWYDVSDEDVLSLVAEFRRERAAAVPPKPA